MTINLLLNMALLGFQRDIDIVEVSSSSLDMPTKTFVKEINDIDFISKVYVTVFTAVLVSLRIKILKIRIKNRLIFPL